MVVVLYQLLPGATLVYIFVCCEKKDLVYHILESWFDKEGREREGREGRRERKGREERERRKGGKEREKGKREEREREGERKGERGRGKKREEGGRRERGMDVHV